MNDLRKYSREFIIEFINLYKSFPAVWKIKSKEYSNRDMKRQAYDVLVEKWKEVEPRANRDFVVKKINSMRTVYRRELKKVENDCSGMGTDEVLTPSLWYFHLLDFLRDQENPRPSISISLEHEMTRDAMQETESESEQIPALSSSASGTVFSTRRPRKKHQNVGGGILTKTSDQVNDPLPKLDRFDYMTKAWAETLRCLPNEQRIFAEKIISDVLFEAQLNTLTRDSQLQVQKTDVQLQIKRD